MIIEGRVLSVALLEVPGAEDRLIIRFTDTGPHPEYYETLVYGGAAGRLYSLLDSGSGIRVDGTVTWNETTGRHSVEQIHVVRLAGKVTPWTEVLPQLNPSYIR